MSATSACPACTAAPSAERTASGAITEGGTILSLPTIHCAACIGSVERALMALPGVEGARVNLSRKRVTIEAPRVPAEDLIAAVEGAGFEAAELDQTLIAAADTDEVGRAILLRLAVAGFAMMNVMLFSVAVWSGATEATRTLFHWISAGIAVPTLVFSAQIFFTSAWSAIRVWRLNMDVPISLAIILAAALSVFETAIGGHEVYFDAALSLTFFLLTGRYLDHRTRQAARSAAQELSALETPRATRILGDARDSVRVQELVPGDMIALSAGMRAPVDGIVASGRSTMDRSLLTGESRAISVASGDFIAAGEVNLSGALTLEVTAVGEDTTLRRMAALVEAAEGARNSYTALADRAAQIYAPAVHLLALATFIGWILVGLDIAPALNIAISVLIITCPCALGLAVPAVMTAATGRLFRRGFLVKNGTALERLAEVDTVIFDKTGTLTEGHASLSVAEMTPEALSVLAALARASDHPVARMLVAALPPGIAPVDLDEATEHPGLGVEATWRGQTVRLGRGSWVGAARSPALVIGEGPAIPLAITETLREGAAETVRELQALGYGVCLISGDEPDAVEAVATRLDLTDWQAQARPDEKVRVIEALEEAGHRVLMVGDGLNDTAALARAYASISPASALDASRTASDIVLLSRSLSDLVDAVRTAKAARRRVIENFGIAAGYNCIAIPIAVLGFASPLGAAIAMSTSSITVLLNALRVR